MKTTAKLALFVLLATAVNFLYAQKVAKYSNEFLSIGVGARALGMGTSVVSSTNDISATYWNPASLTILDKQIEIAKEMLRFKEPINKITIYTGLSIEELNNLKQNINK